jgi:hypothetical protein
LLRFKTPAGAPLANALAKDEKGPGEILFWRREMIKKSVREISGDIVGRGQPECPGSEGASPNLSADGSSIKLSTCL